MPGPGRYLDAGPLPGSDTPCYTSPMVKTLAQSARRSKGTPQRSVRVADPLWFAALKKAKRRNETLASVITKSLQSYVDGDDNHNAA